jgi:hypothetical protein
MAIGDGGLISLGSVFFTVIVIGIGYVGLWIKYRSQKKEKTKEFYDMNSYDKAIQSLIIGVICFLAAFMSIAPRDIPFAMSDMTSEVNVISIIFLNPILFFFVEFSIVLMIGLYLGLFDQREKDIIALIKSIPSTIHENYGLFRLIVTIIFILTETILFLSLFR